MTLDRRVSVTDHETETIEVVEPSNARHCDHCRHEPAEWVVVMALEDDYHGAADPIELDVCGTCLARLQRQTKEAHDITIVQRGERPASSVPAPAGNLFGFVGSDEECRGK